MPSPLFQDLALSQLELLASSLLWKEEDDNDDDRCCGTNRTSSTSSKIKSLAVYLPQENARTGQLEFLPAVVFPNPHTERIFIASDSDSGVAPEFLPTLTMLLPGFARATSLLPGYPMLLLQESNDAGVGFVEEVGVWGGGNGTALSVPLLAGTQTVGVLLVSPVLRRRRPGRQQQQRSTTTSTRSSSMWSEYDRQQVARAAKSLSLALSLDNERTAARIQNQHVRDALSDSLHQFKNPLQALRTYGKLLQRRMAVVDGPDTTGKKTTTTLELAEHLLAQSERLVERLKPVDAIVDSMLAMTPTRGDERPLLALKPVEAKALVPWKKARDPSPIVWHIRNDVTTEPLPLRRGEKIIPSTRTMLMPDEPATTRMRSTTRMETPSKVSSIFLNGSLKLEMSFVSDVLTPVFSVFRDIATERGIFFTVDDEFDDELPGVLVCRQALQEVVINLLDNAFIYSTPGPFDSAASSPSRNPHVRVRLFPNQYRGVHTTSTNVQPGVTILVEDNGPGIIEQDREKVFVRGYRSPLTSEIANGSGIGLDIAQSLSTAMGATLRVVDNRSYANSLSGAIVEFVLFRKPQIPM